MKFGENAGGSAVVADGDGYAHEVHRPRQASPFALSGDLEVAVAQGNDRLNQQYAFVAGRALFRRFA